MMTSGQVIHDDWRGQLSLSIHSQDCDGSSITVQAKSSTMTSEHLALSARAPFLLETM
jgi:hypothetical protein